jgi:hypothetical protein
MRWVRYALAGVAMIIAGCGIALATLSAMLPSTACRVGDKHYEAQRLEISYAAVVQNLGCDGWLASRNKLADNLDKEIYRWRGDCWPYHRVSLTFYNGIAHEKTQEKLCFAVSWPWLSKLTWKQG